MFSKVVVTYNYTVILELKQTYLIHADIRLVTHVLEYQRTIQDIRTVNDFSALNLAYFVINFKSFN